MNYNLEWERRVSLEMTQRQMRKNRNLLRRKKIPDARRTFLIAAVLLSVGLISVLLLVHLRQRVCYAAEPEKHLNRLGKEKSPYLLQHATNPVDWYPWGDEAFERAVKEDKPVLLSIGYSTCHWCHVMERESYSDPEVARLMNETLIAVKVDREERPDIDALYMSVCQMMSGNCGWPLNVFLTPDEKPFFATTYIPRESVGGRVGMLELIPRIGTAWKTRRKEITDSAESITLSLKAATSPEKGELLGQAFLERAFKGVASQFDKTNAGFGGAPKFPRPHVLLFLLRYWSRTHNVQALQMVERNLQAMRQGGIYDQVGLGFHRYSTDAIWRVPHFEKMLYDQALLAMAYTEAYQATGKTEYETTAREIFTYVLRDMTAPNGGFYSAEDADSEGEEGKFYLWTLQQIHDVLSAEEADLVIRTYSMQLDGNFTDSVTQKKPGTNILYLSRPLKAVASEFRVPEDTLNQRLESARQKLFAARNRRVHPGKDDKEIVDWNGLMIAALARAAQAFDDPEYARAASRAADFILNTLRQPDGGLLHRYRDGDAAVRASIDDYAFLVLGLTDLYEATFEARYLYNAIELNEYMIAHFWDTEKGGFFFTPDNGEALVVRQKEIYDGAEPSGNSVALLNQFRLSGFAGDSRYSRRGEDLIRTFSEQVTKSPFTYTYFLMGLEFQAAQSYEVVIAGDPERADTKAMVRAVRSRYLPNKVLLFRPDNPAAAESDRLPPFTEYQTSIDGKATAYVCVNFICNSPTTDINTMIALLSKAPSLPPPKSPAGPTG